jgi:FHS family L-fucose permease-like MFS transporter
MKTSTTPVVPRQYLIPFILLTSLFAAWGLANNLTDVLLATFRRIMSMSDFQTSWIQVAFYGSYFCLALPAAVFIRRYSYKAGVLLGLGLFAAAALLFYPASQTMVYGHFLAALFVLAGGLSILETSANPYIIVLGPEETATRRLNLAQSFNPIGSIAGVVIGKVFILSQLNQASEAERSALAPEALDAMVSSELSAVMGPYVVIALVILALWVAIAVSHFPRASEPSTDGLLATLSRLVKVRHYRFGVVAQFFYVGAQIGVWSFTIRYVMAQTSLDEQAAATYYLASILLFAGSRFACTALMKYVSPDALLRALSMLAVVLSLMVILAGGTAGVFALVALSACMSLMFPTIYGLAISGLAQDTKIAGAGLIMAILGGAILTAVQGRVLDALGIEMAYLVPLVCFLAIAWYALRGWKPVS